MKKGGEMVVERCSRMVKVVRARCRVRARGRGIVKTVKHRKEQWKGQLGKRRSWRGRDGEGRRKGDVKVRGSGCDEG